MLCNECRNDGICKYKEESEKIWKQAKDITPSVLSPIEIKIECIRFEKKGQKQDGIWNTQK